MRAAVLLHIQINEKCIGVNIIYLHAIFVYSYCMTQMCIARTWYGNVAGWVGGWVAGWLVV